MPQARLPDINTAFIKHRNEAIASLKSGNYDAMFGSLYALNALLPETIDEDSQRPKYRVVISDIEYNKLTKPTIHLYCYHCNADKPENAKDLVKFEYEKIKVFNQRLSVFDQQLGQTMYEKAWFCKKCKKVCKLKRTRMTETQIKEPYFLGVVPKPPERKFGFVSHTDYHNKIRQWGFTMIDELENMMAKFRDDNWTKDDQAKENLDLDTIDGGETPEREGEP